MISDYESKEIDVFISTPISFTRALYPSDSAQSPPSLRPVSAQTTYLDLFAVFCWICVRFSDHALTRLNKMLYFISHYLTRLKFLLGANIRMGPTKKWDEWLVKYYLIVYIQIRPNINNVKQIMQSNVRHRGS